MKEITSKALKSIAFYTTLYIFLYFCIGMLLSMNHMTYVLWFKQFSLFIVSLGIIATTIQYNLRGTSDRKLGLCILLVVIELFLSSTIFFGFMFFQDEEEVVTYNGQKMIKVTHSVLVSNWIEYYESKNAFIRSSQPSVHEVYNNTLHEYLYTIYYDEAGNVINREP